MIAVLYVDDDPDLADLARIFLGRESDLTVKSVISAQEALETLVKEKFDLVVSDYQMPETDGICLFRILRMQENRIPFILFTGNGREEVAAEALDAGVDSYVRKGGDPGSQFHYLADKIRTTYRRYEASRLLRAHAERLDLAIQASEDGIVDIDIPSGEILAGTRSSTLLGFDTFQAPATLGGMLSLTHPDDRAILIKAIQRITGRKGESSFVAETRIRESINNWRYIQTRCIVVARTEEGTALRLVGTVRDITAWKRREERDRRALEFCSSILEEEEDGLLFLDCEGEMVLWNQRFEEIWDIRPGTIDPTTPLHTCLPLIQKVRDPTPLLNGLDPRGSEGGRPRSGTLTTINDRVIGWEASPFTTGNEVRGTIWRFTSPRMPRLQKPLKCLQNERTSHANIASCIQHSLVTLSQTTDIRIPVQEDGKAILLGPDGTITAWSKEIGQAITLPPSLLKGADPLQILAFPDADTEESFSAAWYGARVRSYPCVIRTREGPIHCQVTVTPLDCDQGGNNGAFLTFRDPL